MATRPISEGASAPSNIVRLPTAAPRKVDNLRFAEQRRAVVEARKGNRWGAATRQEVERIADTRRRYSFMEGVEREPALLLTMALLKSADPVTMARVCSWTANAVFRDPECHSTWQAHQIAMTLAGYRKEGQ